MLKRTQLKLLQQVKKIGADATIDYKKSPEDQLKDLMSATEGKFTKVFDAVAFNVDFAKSAFKELTQGPKYFSTTNDWSVHQACRRWRDGR
jgi:hypothetical protein